MALDPQIPLQAGQGVTPPQNPLDTFGKYQGVANAMATNDLIKANTAQTNQNVAQSAGNYMAQKYASFLSLPKDMQTQANARQFVDHGLAEGSITPQVAAVMHDKINGTKNVGDLQTLAVQGMLGNLGGQQAVDNVFGSTTTHDVGGAIVPGRTPSPVQQVVAGQPGFVPSGGDLTKGLTPPEQIAPTTIPTLGPDGKATGAGTVVTGNELAARTGNQHLLPGAGPWGNGRVAPPPGLANPNKAPAASPPQTAPGNLGTTLTPGQTAAQTQLAGDSAKRFTDISDQAVRARAQDAVLANMQADANQFTTGAGADKIKSFQNAVLRVTGPTGLAAFGVKPEALAANESFDKLANQIADAQGAGSDARLAVNQAANPNSHTSPAGVDMILRQLRGNADYLKARATLAAAHPDQSKIQDFETNVGANMDPRVFQYARLTPEQKTPYVKSLTDPKDFMTKYRWAEQNRLVGGQ